MSSKWLPSFKRQLASLKAGDKTDEVFVRDVMASLMKPCPIDLLIRLGEQIMAYHEEEWRRYHEQN